MSKAMLIIDMPKCCAECPCLHDGDFMAYCGVSTKELTGINIFNKKPNHCGLIQVTDNVVMSKDVVSYLHSKFSDEELDDMMKTIGEYRGK